MIDRHTQLEAFRKSMGEPERHALSDVPFGYPRNTCPLDGVPPFCNECACGGDWHYRLCSVAEKRGDTLRLMRPEEWAGRDHQCIGEPLRTSA